MLRSGACRFGMLWNASMLQHASPASSSPVEGHPYSLEVKLHNWKHNFFSFALCDVEGDGKPV